MRNALTIDVEDWYQTQDFHFEINTWSNYECRIQANTERILDMLQQNNTKATFFILGYVAQRHPELIKKIKAQGHEIGSHGMFHQMINKLDKNSFRADVSNSKKLLEDISGDKVVIYRSSSWSMSAKTLWAYDILEEEGYTIDSSMQPFVTPLSGTSDIPFSPFHPVINGKRYDILEFPVTVMPVGKFCFPFSGGLYLRILPFSIIKYCLKNINKSSDGMIYTHPWELDINQPKLKVSPLIEFVHYYNIKNTKNKLVKIVEDFKITTLGEIIKGKTFPDYILK